MKGLLAASVVALSAILAASAFASSSGGRIQGRGATDTLAVNTSGCPGFVTPQPYFLADGNTIKMTASWRYSYVWVEDSPNPMVDIRGTMKGEGVDLNTALTYKLFGKFSNDVFTSDILGGGKFTIRRSDGATMTFDAWFNYGGPGSPEVGGASPVCRPPTH